MEKSVNLDKLSIPERLLYWRDIDSNLPEQRSPAWLEYRKGKLTASTLHKCLLYTKIEAELEAKGEFESRKKTPKIGGFIRTNPVSYMKEKAWAYNDAKYFSGVAALHGNTFEDAVVKIYEKKYKTKVHEFGCLPHPTISFLAASPDGIDSHGRMVEIKCPYSREIHKTPPIDYWMQTQMQMEVCGFDVTHFIECDIKEYETCEAYRKDEFVDVEGNSVYGLQKCGREKGCVLKWWGKNVQGMVKTEFECMPVDCLNHTEMQAVLMEKITHLVKQHLGLEYHSRENTIEIPKIYDHILEGIDAGKFEVAKGKAEDYDIRTPILGFEMKWWKLNEFSLKVIKRNREWFQTRLPDLQKFWNTVLKWKKEGVPDELCTERENRRKRGLIADPDEFALFRILDENQDGTNLDNLPSMEDILKAPKNQKICTRSRKPSTDRPRQKKRLSKSPNKDSKVFKSYSKSFQMLD